MWWFTFLKVVMMILEVMVSIMLIGVILLQRTKSQGAGGLAFGAGMGETIFGTQAGNVLTRTTIVLGIVFLVNTAALSIVYSSPTRHARRSVVDTVPASTALPRPLTAPPPGAPMDTPSEGTPVPATPAPVDVPAQSAPATP
jgi:preprotein translocase subunit SecG